MPAYKVLIVKEVCAQCQRPATHIVFSGVNDRIGPRCKACADVLVRQLNHEGGKGV